MFFRLFITILAICLTASNAAACPLIDEIIDYNCNRAGKITITGDSFVNGVGDSKKGGGYVGRLEDEFNTFRFTETGVNGVTPFRLRRNFLRFYSRKKTTFKRTNDSDIIIIDVGRNSYWAEDSPEKTVRDLKRLVKTLKKITINDESDTAPFIFVATLMPTTRGFQAPFVNEVNRLILKQKSAKNLPAYIRFDKLPTSGLGEDGLHPNPRGYKKAAKFLFKFLNGKAQKLMSKSRQDADADGVYDYYETLRFGTDPELDDTDGDTVVDGVELFTDDTDPLDGADHA